MKTILAALISAVVLAACATPNELRQRTPDLELSSDKTPKQVALCITDRWENNNSFGSLPIAMRETESGYTVAMNCSGNTCFMADISPAPQGGSKTSLYTHTPSGAGAYVTHTRACQ